jgi:oxysterol-binding protein-related protein 9/10/11
VPSRVAKQPPTDPRLPPSDSHSNPAETLRISYLTEQTSHHPPVSAYHVECPARGISARGFDQLSAKFTGTAIRVIPGNFNLGIFVTLHNRGDEEYQLTHPDANLGGLLRGSLSISVADTCFVTCPKTKLKAILHYLDEGWIGKSQNIVQGVIYRYDPDNDKITKLKDIPEKSIVARIEGCWKEKIYYTIPSTPAISKGPNAEPTDKKQLLVDLVPLTPVPKIVPPEENQLPNESRIFWKDVTNAIINKQYGEATKAKQAIEERQREKAAERQARNEEWKPRFFTEPVGPKGRPELNEEGRKVLKGMQELKFHLKEADITAA